MEARRKKGMGLLARGVTQAEVARRCEVSTPTALRWRRALVVVGGQVSYSLGESCIQQVTWSPWSPLPLWGRSAPGSPLVLLWDRYIWG